MIPTELALIWEQRQTTWKYQASLPVGLISANSWRGNVLERGNSKWKNVERKHLGCSVTWLDIKRWACVYVCVWVWACLHACVSMHACRFIYVLGHEPWQADGLSCEEPWCHVEAFILELSTYPHPQRRYTVGVSICCLWNLPLQDHSVNLSHIIRKWKCETCQWSFLLKVWSTFVWST